MKYKAELKVRYEEKERIDRKYILRRIMDSALDQLPLEQLEKLIDLKEYDPYKPEHFNSSVFPDRSYANDFRSQLFDEHVVLYRATLNLPD